MNETLSGVVFGFPHAPGFGTPRWWIVRVARAGRTFLGIIGFLCVSHAPLTTAEATPGAITGAIVLECCNAYRDWRARKSTA